MEISKDHLEADRPASDALGRLFDEFCDTDFGVNLLDANVIRDGDAYEFKQHILRNRMRRGFEAGFIAGKESLLERLIEKIRQDVS